MLVLVRKDVKDQKNQPVPVAIKCKKDSQFAGAKMRGKSSK